MKLFPKSRGARIALVLVTAALVVFLCSGWVVSFFLDLEAAREQVAAEISQKLHRRVKIGHLSVGFFSATMKYVTIYDRADFGGEPVLTVHKATASVRPLELLRGRLAIAHIKARRPVLVIKRSASGDLNISDLLHLQKDPARGSEALPRAAKKKNRFGLHEVDVEKVVLSLATVKFSDQAVGRTTVIPGVDVTCQGDLGDDPIRIAYARVQFQRLSIRIAGEVARDLKKGWVKAHVDALDLMSYKEYMPFLSGFETGSWQLRDIALSGKIADAALDIEDLSCRPSGGQLKATGKVWIEQGKPFFQVNAQAEGVQLDPMLWQTRTDKVSFGGKLSGACSVAGKGVAVEDVKAGLSGNAELTVTDGRFQNKVFIKIGEIARKVFHTRDYDEYRANEAHGHFQIGEGKVCSSDLRFDSKNLFDIYLAAPGYVSMDGALFIPKVVLSAGSEEDSVQVPIKIKGQVNRPKVDVEWKALRKRLIGQ